MRRVLVVLLLLASAAALAQFRSMNRNRDSRLSFAAPSWEALSTPIVIAHRGSGNIVTPENTLAAYNWASLVGYPIECDVAITSDEVLVCSHDLTTTRMALDGGTISSMTLAQVRELDVSQGYIPAVFSPQRMPTFAEFMTYAPANLLAPEAKATATKTGNEMATLVAQAAVASGAPASFLIQSFAVDPLKTAKAVAPQTRTLLLGSTTAAAAKDIAVDAGVWAVGVEKSAITEAYVDEMQDAGVKVLAYTVNSLREADSLNALGVDGFFSDDAAHIARFSQRIPTGTTTISPPPSLPASGWRWASTRAGAYPAVVGGFATFAGYGAFTTTDNFRLVAGGLRTADSPATQTITTTLKVVAWGGVDATRYMMLRFAWNREEDGTNYPGTSPSSGYYIAHRLNGGIELVKVVNAATTTLATTTWPAIALGQEVPLRVDLTSSGITVTRTDTGDTISGTDSALGRGGFVVAFGSGVVPGIGPVTVTY